MYVVSNTGDFECSTLQEFTDKLKACFENESGNEIWCLPHKDEEFPCIGILVGKTGVSITYFSENNEQQFASVGNQERDDIEEFLGGQYQVVGYQIVSCEEAIECAIEFFETRQRSLKIKWEEL